MDARWQKIGRFRAIVNPAFDSPALRAALAGIEDLAKSGDAVLLQAGRHRTVRLDLPLPCADSAAGARPAPAVAKFFGRQSPAKDLCDRLGSGKARRTYEAALFLSSAGIGTTPPVACLERWRGARLESAVFVSQWVGGMVCFKDVLVSLWRDHAPYSRFLEAMRLAADGIRALHDAGCLHGDLGNQNVFFIPSAPSLPPDRALFLDLNRARFQAAAPGPSARARDLARICLPEGFLEVFHRMYWRGEPPAEFRRASRAWRALFAFHTVTRRFRHPFREAAYRRDPASAPAQAPYPEPAMQWVWDDAAMRPAPVAPDAALLHFAEPQFRRQMAVESARLAALARRMAAGPVAAAPGGFTGGIRQIVAAPGQVAGASRKVLVRIAAADAPEVTATRIGLARSLAEGGRDVAVQFLQRPEFLGGATFGDFAERTLRALGFAPSWLCLGQGPGSPSWGVRTAGERDRIATLAAALQASGAVGPQTAVLPAAVEAPVLGPWCAGCAAPLAAGARVALAWSPDDGPLDAALRDLRALALALGAPEPQVIVISQTHVERGAVASAALPVAEICAPVA